MCLVYRRVLYVGTSTHWAVFLFLSRQEAYAPIPVKFEGLLTPSLLYQAHMEYKIRGHREVDLSLTDDIHYVVQRHSANGLDFNAFIMLKRDILLQRMSDVYNLQHLKPTIYKVSIQEKNVLTSVAVFDLHAQFFQLCTMQNSCSKKSLHQTMMFSQESQQLS